MTLRKGPCLALGDFVNLLLLITKFLNVTQEIAMRASTFKTLSSDPVFTLVLMLFKFKTLIEHLLELTKVNLRYEAFKNIIHK